MVFPIPPFPEMMPILEVFIVKSIDRFVKRCDRVPATISFGVGDQEKDTAEKPSEYLHKVGKIEKSTLSDL